MAKESFWIQKIVPDVELDKISESISKVPLGPFLNIGYFLFISPFKLISANNEKILIYTNKLQVFIAVLLNTSLLYCMVVNLILNLTTPDLKSPTELFSILAKCFRFTRRLYTFMVQRLCSKHFQILCSTLNNYFHSGGEYFDTRSSKLVIGYVFVSHIVMFVTYWSGTLTQEIDGKVQVLDNLVRTSREIFFTADSNSPNIEYYTRHYIFMIITTILDTMK